MTEQRSHPLESIVSGAISGAAITQTAIHRDWIESPMELEPGLCSSLYSELENDIGLDFDAIAYNVLIGIYIRLSGKGARVAAVAVIAHMLWKKLGSPSINGDKPPEIYKEAAALVYAWVLALFDPDIDTSD